MIDINIAFEVNKLKRLLKSHGNDYNFTIQEVNEFKEKRDSSTVLNIRGIYHEMYYETNSAVAVRNMDGSRIQKVPVPMILTLWEYTPGLSIDSITSINGKTYKVAGVNNIQEQNAIADIRLEVIQ